jgi:hypothetical protein
LDEALDHLLTNQELAARCRARAAEVRERFRWSVVLGPLADFCRDPRRAPDLAAKAHAATVAGPEVGAVLGHGAAPAPARVHGALQLARHHYSEGGLRQVARQAVAKALRLAHLRQ